MRFRRPSWVRASNLAVGALVLATSGLFLASPAEATTATYTNPTACSASVQNGVCISTVSVDYETATVTLAMTVGKATDPSTDPNWLTADFPTEVVWGISTGSAATTPAYIAEADSNLNTPGTFSGVVTPGSSPITTLCDSTKGVTVSFDLAANEYSLSFPSSCIGSPASLSVQAGWDYSTAANNAGVSAAAPGDPQTFSTCCTVTPSADATTSTTTTTTADPSSSTTTSTTTSSSSTTSTTTAAPVTTTTIAPVTSASVSSPNSGNSGSGTSSSLAATGGGGDTPLLLGVGVLLALGGTVGRLARRRKFTRHRAG
jgi:hypothetical protein